MTYIDKDKKKDIEITMSSAFTKFYNWIMNHKILTGIVTSYVLICNLIACNTCIIHPEKVSLLYFIVVLFTTALMLLFIVFLLFIISFIIWCFENDKDETFGEFIKFK